MNTLFILNGSTANRGCEAILLSTYDIIREGYPGARFINAAEKGYRDDKIEYLQLPNLVHHVHPSVGLSPSFLRWQIAKRLQGHAWNFQRCLPNADIVLSLGGDNYSLDYGAIDKYLNCNDLVLGAGKKLVIWGASIGPFESGSKIEDSVCRSLSVCHAVVVRERLTRDYLASLGVSRNVHLMPDPAFSLASEPIALSQEVESMLLDGAIGFNVSPLLSRYRQDPEAWANDAANWLSSIVAATSSPILLVPHVMHPGNDDHLFLSEIMKLAGFGEGNGRVRLLDAYEWSSRQLKFVIGRLRAFIGARTHATIASMSQGVPTISIGYSVKARGINLEVFGDERWVIDHKELTGKKLAERLLDLLGNEEQLRAHLAKKNRYYRMDPVAVARILSA